MLNDIQNKNLATSEELEKMVFTGDFITILDKEYPEALKQSYKPPFVLFYKGNLNLLNNSQRNLLISGTRNPTEEGIAFTNELMENGLDKNIVVSLTKGLNEIVIKKCDTLISVLAGGLESAYYHSGRIGQLFNKVLEKGGLIISEYPLDTPPEMENFSFKTRIETAIAQKSLILESTKKGVQSLIIMNTLQLGKDVLVVPVSPLNKNSNNNKFIGEGAYSVYDKESLNSYLEEQN